MKKIISILFLFLLCYACYYIYNITEDNNLYMVAIGDEIAANPFLKDNKMNTDFINKDYHINDLLNIIKYNQEITKNNKEISIHQQLKKADVLIISIGMNDIYYKLDDDPKEMYSYLNDILNNYEKILNEINKYDYKNVYILNYYNTTNKYNDLFVYTNYKLNKLANKYHYTYIDIAKILNNKQEYYQKNNDFNLNNNGYRQIFEFLVENLKKTWYNIKCIYYYDLY